jgi:hypothetical protein
VLKEKGTGTGKTMEDEFGNWKKKNKKTTHQTTSVNKTARTTYRCAFNHLRMMSPYPMVVHVMTAQYNDVKYLSHGVATPMP